MTRIHMNTIREISEGDLRQRIQELRGDLAKLKTDGAKGTLRKENGKIRSIKKDIARMMTRLNEIKQGRT